MSRQTNTTNVIMKMRYWSKTTPRYLTFEDDNICVSSTLLSMICVTYIHYVYTFCIQSYWGYFYSYLEHILDNGITDSFQSAYIQDWTPLCDVLIVCVYNGIVTTDRKGHGSLSFFCSTRFDRLLCTIDDTFFIILDI